MRRIIEHYAPTFKPAFAEKKTGRNPALPAFRHNVNSVSGMSVRAALSTFVNDNGNSGERWRIVDPARPYSPKPCGCA